MTKRPRSDSTEYAAALEHLTGPSRGGVAWLAVAEASVFIGQDRLIHIRSNPDPAPDEMRVASLAKEASTYRINPAPGVNVRINRQIAGSRALCHGDTIEFGETGPISRFRLFDHCTRLRWPIEEVLGDSISYLRFSRRPLGVRLIWAAREFLRRLVTDTSTLFRITVVLALVALAVTAFMQYRTGVELRETLEREELRLEGIAAALVRAREEALRASDLSALREELTERMAQSRDRIVALERRSAAAARVIAATTPSVVLLQGSYGLRHVETNRMLRHVLSPSGIPLILPNGQPFLALDGDGPVAEVHFTGTAFVLAGAGLLVTNRHVAVPWETGTDMGSLKAQGMEPVMLRFQSFFPDIAEPATVDLVTLSDEADLAILKMDTAPDDGRGLVLADDSPRPGDEIFVMGYPTGLRSLLAQAGPEFVKELQKEEDTDFWSVSLRLARARLIAPLASSGIVGQVGEQAVVYDAETTHGGSGGPVLNAEGEVVAVNAAILPEFGGSNLGVPVARLRALLTSPGQ